MKSTLPIQTALKPTKASDIMSQPVISVFIKDTIQSVADLFLKKNISGVPVLGEDGYVVGVLTKTDLARFDQRRVEVLAKERTSPSKVAETGERIPGGFNVAPEDENVEQWFNPKVQWVLPDAPLAEVSDKMWKHHIHHLFVKDADSKNLLGVITTFDLLGELTRRLKKSSSHL